MQITPDNINKAMIEVFGLPTNKLRERSQESELSLARHALAYVLKENKIDSKYIVYVLQRDRTTIRHSITKCIDLMYFDKKYKAKVERLNKLLTS